MKLDKGLEKFITFAYNFLGCVDNYLFNFRVFFADGVKLKDPSVLTNILQQVKYKISPMMQNEKFSRNNHV